MKAEGFTEKDIKEARHKEVFNPCTRVKLAVASKKIPLGNILDETLTGQKDQDTLEFCEKLTKPTVIKNSEALLSKEQSSTVDVDKFLRYINARASMDKVLSQYYGTETQKSEEIHSPDSCFDFHVNEKGNLYFGGLYVTRIQDFPQQHNMVSLEKLTNSQWYATYIRIMIQQTHISRRLDDAVKAEVLALANEMFTSEQAGLRQRASELLEKLQILPFRKSKFLIKLYYNQIDEKLVRNLQEKFGSDAILVFGNWSAANTKYHEPTRNKSLIRMLKKNGFTVHLADKFKTSSKCP
ncbi:hypothetical protein HPULCUR_000076 [Helicostylum pulchrum]|uniref:Uncharacterized protein n=1 Tax=Helicostylum pulchrum TaxID=562976 RepID=A0ABP9XIU2_9FUNG